jgi:hypothetical protein
LCFLYVRAAALSAIKTESMDGSNANDTVRYVRRRKFGQKRRSIYVKRRMPIASQKTNKNDSIMTNEDSCAHDSNIPNDDEHSQEYISRRRVSTIDESNKEEEEEGGGGGEGEGEGEQQSLRQENIENEHDKNEEEITKQDIPLPSVSSPKSAVKEPTFKQLKLDQFLKSVRPVATNDSISTDNEQQLSNHQQISISNDKEENTMIDCSNVDHQEMTPRNLRRITRNTRFQSNSDLVPITIGSSLENSISTNRK